MPKRKKDEELVPGVPMREVLEFLCRQARALDINGSSGRGPDEDDRFEAPFEFSGHRDEAMRALIAKGWIVEAKSKQPRARVRYRLTEAGRQLAVQSAPLFKWPAAQSDIAPPSRHSGWLECLMHLQGELSRMGMTPEDLAPYQRTILQDIKEGLDEAAVASMHDFWNYNAKALEARRHDDNRLGGLRAGRPRIDVLLHFNIRGRLIVEWEPAGLKWDKKPTAECDWTFWQTPNGSHPHNELFDVAELKAACRHFPGMFDASWRTADSIMVDAILLQAAHGLVVDLKERLKLSFEVRMVSDIFATYETLIARQPRQREREVLATWTIEHVEDRRKRIELRELERLPEEVGCPLNVFVNALVEADTKKPTGPAPSSNTKDERVSKALKKAGYGKLTPSVVARFRRLLQDHRPDLLPSECRQRNPALQHP